MKKGIRNLLIGVSIGIVAGGLYFLSKEKSASNELVVKSLPNPKTSTSEMLPDPRLEEVVVYKDGSMDFHLDFSEEYGLEEKPREISDTDNIDYIEVFDEEGNSKKLNYNEYKEYKRAPGEREFLPDPTLESVTHYEDGSMRFHLNFPDGYDLPESKSVEDNTAVVNYTEVFNPDGTSDIIYPAAKNNNVKVKRL